MPFQVFGLFCRKSLKPRWLRVIRSKVSGHDMQHYQYGDFVKHVARRLRQLRTERGYSQRAFAREHGWLQEHWVRVESGRKMSLETLLKAANSFDMSVSELIDDAARHEGPGPGSKGFLVPKE